MFISNFLLAIVGYSTSRILMPILSLGRITVQPPMSEEQGFNSFGFKRIPGHGLLCHTSVAGCLGLIPSVILIVVVLFKAHAG